jgi:hypothetical protein
MKLLQPAQRRELNDGVSLLINSLSLSLSPSLPPLPPTLPPSLPPTSFPPSLPLSPSQCESRDHLLSHELEVPFVRADSGRALRPFQALAKTCLPAGFSLGLV